MQDGTNALSNGMLTLYSGGYDTFEETRRERQRLQLKLKNKQDDVRRHMEAFVERFRAKATKARQAQSRLKALARMQPIAAEIESEVNPFLFPTPVARLGNPLIRLENTSVGYASTPVLHGLNLRLDVDDRIGLLGANGNGKSTLAKLLCGHLKPLSGERRASKKMIHGYFAQHQLDELNPLQSAYDHIAALMPDATEAQKRARVAAAGFGVDKADVAAAKLSGGEKARLLFAMVSFHAPHLLILDEPTNHLDVDSREALIHALNDYEGAVVIISHDRHLLEATVDRLWIVHNGTAMPYHEDLDTYRAECLAVLRDQRRNTVNLKPETNSKNRQDERRAAANARAELAPLKKKISVCEKQVAALSKKLEHLDEKLADATLYEREPAQAQVLLKDRGQLAKALDEAEELWLRLSEEYEEARQVRISAGAA
jgi:ATP-binding cassette subfamily F protein 3